MTTNTLAKLAACPFCAGAARRSNGGEGKRAYFGAGCNTHKCPAELHALFYKSQDAADEAWNRRALTAQALPAAGRCDECGKDQAEGWALYCVDCMEKTGLLAKEALPNAQHVSSTAADLTGPNNTTAQATTGAATTGAPSEPFGYFKAEPFGWTDCAETDDGAVALYERPNAGGQIEQVAKLHGTRKVLWDLLGECLPLLKVDAEFSTDYEGKEAIELLIEQIEAARSRVQSDELPQRIGP